MFILKKYVLILFCLCCSLIASAQVVSGGELFDLIYELSIEENSEKKADILSKLAGYYETKAAYSKSINYAREAIAIYDDNNKPHSLLREWLRVAELNRIKGNVEGTVNSYLQVLDISKKIGADAEYKVALQALVKEYVLDSAYSKAQIRNRELLQLLSGVNNSEYAFALNNQGFILQALGEKEASKTQYEQALVAYKSLARKPGVEEGDINRNLAVAQASIGNYQDAISTLKNYLSQDQSSKKDIVQTRSFLSALLLAQANYDEALSEIERAISLGQEISDLNTLISSYKVQSEILNAMGEYDAGQEAFKRYLRLIEEQEKNLQEQQSIRQEAEIAAERSENLIKETLSAKREQELALRQVQLEAEKQEKELALQEQQVALLRRDKELRESQLANEELQRKQIQQALLLARQQLAQQEKEEEILKLEQEKKLQDAALKQKELEEQERQQALQLAEAQNRLKDQKLQEQSQQRFFYFIIMGLGSILFLGALFGLYQRNKATNILKKQKGEIHQKNEELLASEEELRQNMEELQSTQDALEVQKTALEESNLQTTQSILYAETIQNAVLPTPEIRAKLLPKSFLIFKPKDIVSGDFFWMSKHDNLIIVGVIDCTGHGVPGAFMSLIGNNLLNEAIMLNQLYEPAKILNMLNRGIRYKLKQHAGMNSDGMDACLITLEPSVGNQYRVRFAGAKRPLWYVQGNQLETVKATRKSIGGQFNADEVEYAEHTLELDVGTRIYLTTDGFQDQANAKRKSFSRQRLQGLIENTANLPLEAQEQQLLQSLAKHQENEDQRDDITLLCIEL